MEILYHTVGVNIKWDTRAFTDATIPRKDGWDKRTDLEEFDYSSCGVYAVTLCTRKRARYFADPVYYQMVEKAWERIPRHFPTVVPDSIGIVPDHIHMILYFEPLEG
jgi:hypothetical protein